jgi:long-chain fatty acid transport protein
MKLKGIGLLGLMMFGGGVEAAGFALIEQNGGLGNAYAGQAATAEDAGTVYFNPAGMSRLDGRQASVSLHYIRPSAEFSGAASPPLSSAGGGDAGRPALVPNAYYVMDLGPGTKFGLGLNSPFGLATEYDRPWAGMTQALKSEVKTYNINPSLSWQPNDRLALGVGVSWQRIEATLSSFNPLASTVVTMEGDDDSWGWNAGALFTLDQATRVGVAYRSQIEHSLGGRLSPMGVPITADIALPDTASVSLFRQISPAWDLLADLTWTGWSSFGELRVRHAASGATLSLVEEDWDDTWRIALGANYHAGKALTWRVGVAYDPTPVPDAGHRTPRIPDEDRTWLAAGVQYRLSERTAIDVGYAHLFVKDAAIDHSESGLTLAGRYDNAVDIVTVQVNHRF